MAYTETNGKIQDKLKEASESKGQKINIKKTFTAITTYRKQISISRVVINRKETEQVTQFKYLWGIIKSDGRSGTDIKTRIRMTK